MANNGDNRANGRDEVRVFQDNTLGRAHGARRVHNASHVIAGRGTALTQQRNGSVTGMPGTRGEAAPIFS